MVSYPIILLQGDVIGYAEYWRLVFSRIYFLLLSQIPLAGGFYQIGGGGRGEESEAGGGQDRTHEGGHGFVGCLQKIFVDKLPGRVKQHSGSPHTNFLYLVSRCQFVQTIPCKIKV